MSFVAFVGSLVSFTAVMKACIVCLLVLDGHLPVSLQMRHE